MLVHLCLSVLLTVISLIVILHCYLCANKMMMMMMMKWEVTCYKPICTVKFCTDYGYLM